MISIERNGGDRRYLVRKTTKWEEAARDWVAIAIVLVGLVVVMALV